MGNQRYQQSALSDQQEDELEIPQKEIIRQQFDRCEKHWLQRAGGPDKNEDQLMRNDQVFSLMRLCSGNNHMTKEECLLFLHRIHLQHKANL